MCQELVTKIPDPNVLVAIEPEELASALLPILKVRMGNDTDINLHNFMLEFDQFNGRAFPAQNPNNYPREFAPRIRTVVLEAIEWMLSKGILAHSFNIYQPYAVFVTRRGRAIQGDGDFSDFRKASLLSP